MLQISYSPFLMIEIFIAVIVGEGVPCLVLPSYWFDCKSSSNNGVLLIQTCKALILQSFHTPYDSAASTPTGANTGGSSFVYLGGQIPIDASTLPNADLPIDPNMLDLEDDSNVFLN
ncbi:hypothetical protein Tco_0350577, partial [Tanacetum coccineum]